MAKRNGVDEMRIVLLRSARVAGVWRAGGWSGVAPAAEAQALIDRGWAVAADRERGGDAGGKRR